MKATATAHPNIALVKYWGKRDDELNLPATGSISLTLEGLSTTTTVDFDDRLDCDVVALDGEPLDHGRPYRRVVAFLDLVRKAAGIDRFARVETANDFPTASGLASSASGFAALATASAAAAGLDWSRPRLSALARRGSGSAARSLFGGFAEMYPGTRSDGRDAHAVEIADADHWQLRCLIALTTGKQKSVGSTPGMQRTRDTSPYFPAWCDTVDGDLRAAREAIEHRDFEQLGTVAERSCLRMHASALSADPGVLYWNGTTVELMHRIRAFRTRGVECFFTIDAGPHVKVFCTVDHLQRLRSMLQKFDGVSKVLCARPGRGARLADAASQPPG